MPPMSGVGKVVAGDHRLTTLGPVDAGFDVVGNKLRYRGALSGLVDVLERDGTSGKSVRFSEDASTAASDLCDSNPRRSSGLRRNADMTAGGI